MLRRRRSCCQLALNASGYRSPIRHLGQPLWRVLDAHAGEVVPPLLQLAVRRGDMRQSIARQARGDLGAAPVRSNSFFRRWSTAQFRLKGKPGGCRTPAAVSSQKQRVHCRNRSTIVRPGATPLRLFPVAPNSATAAARCVACSRRSMLVVRTPPTAPPRRPRSMSIQGPSPLTVQQTSGHRRSRLAGSHSRTFEHDSQGRLRHLGARQPL